MEAVTKGDKIGAIKILRQESGLGLKEAKDAVDAYVASRPELAGQFQATGTGNRLRTLLVLILLVVIFLLYKFINR